MSTRGLVHGLAHVWAPAGSDVLGLVAVGAAAWLWGHVWGRVCVGLVVHGTGCAQCTHTGLGTCRCMHAGPRQAVIWRPWAASPLLPSLPLSPLLSATTVNTFCCMALPSPEPSGHRLLQSSARPPLTLCPLPAGTWGGGFGPRQCCARPPCPQLCSVARRGTAGTNTITVTLPSRRLPADVFLI